MRHAIEHFWGVLMGTTDLVRSSRDGDQFHYLWASRRALLLLDPKSNLHTITIEGPSKTAISKMVKKSLMWANIMVVTI